MGPVKLFQSFRLDTVNHCVWRAGTRVPLTPKAFDLLRYLVEHSGRVVSQNEILEALWPDTYVNPEVIKKYILSIRRVLGDSPDKPEFIETIPRRGYRFLARVTDESDATPPSASSAVAKANVVGREAVIAELEHHLATALAGRRQLIFVTGEAGIGKTTVVDLFHQRSAGHANLRIARGQCVEGFGGKEAYYSMLEALGQLTRDRDSDHIIENLAKRAPTWLIQFPALLEPEQRQSLQTEIIGASRERMVREICELLEALTSDTPLMIVLEDLHWVDPSTLDVISALARRREPAKLFLLCTYRPVDVVLSQGQLKSLKQDLQVRHLCREIALDRLKESDVADYLKREFEDSDFPPDLAGFIHRQSTGHALFMTAIVHELIKKGCIARADGRWNLTQPLQEVDPGVPETLQKMLELQVDQLSPTEQRILKSASVFGDRFSVWVVSPTLETPANEIEALCEDLAERGQFIQSAGMQEIGDGVSAHYEFRHSLYRQVIYRCLSEVSRARMHRLLGERLKLLCTPGRQDVAAEIAMHFEQGHEYDQAINYLVLAAENAGKRFAYRQSIQILQHALELLHTVHSGRLIEIELQILELIGDTQYYLGEMSEAARTYETQATRAAEAGLKAAELVALEHLVMPLGFIDPDRGILFAEKALQLSAKLNDSVFLARAEMLAAGYRCVYGTWREEDWELWSHAHNTLCCLNGSPLPPYHQSLYSYLLVLRGEYEEASKLLVIPPSSLNSETVSMMFHFFAVSSKTLSLLYSGRLGELFQLVTEGRESAVKNGNDPWLFVFREAWLRTLVFDFEGARRLCESVISSTTVYPTDQPKTIGRIAQGYAELEHHRYEEAIACFTEVLDPRRTPKFFLHWVWRMTAQLGVSEVWLQAGNLVNARLHANAFLESALLTAEPNVRTLAWELQTRIAMAEQNTSSAEHAIKKGLEILDTFEVPIAAWQLHATAWDFYRTVINNDAADYHLERAAKFVLRIADSFVSTEPLRETFLTAARVRRIIDHAHSRPSSVN